MGSSSTTRSDRCFLVGGGGIAFFGLAKAASSGWNKTFLSDPPACSTSCAVTLAARSTLARSISKYFCDPSLPSQMFSMAALVPEMISSRLFNSLVAAGAVAGGLAGAGFSEGSMFYEAKIGMCVMGLSALSQLGFPSINKAGKVPSRLFATIGGHPAGNITLKPAARARFRAFSPRWTVQ